MAHETYGEAAQAADRYGAVQDDLELFEDDEFDPFAADVDQPDDEAEDDQITDLPMMSELPESHRVRGRYDKTNYTSAQDALRELLRGNPARRQVLVAIIDACNDPHTTSEVAQVVEGVQRDNLSVYTPLSLCRMLETAGALTAQVPESSEEEVDEDGDGYLEVKEPREATWTATDAGLEVVSELREGNEVRELVGSASESPYRDIYLRLLDFCAEQGRSAKEVGALIDDDPLVQNPRRYGAHFIDGMEATGALVWRDKGWHTTELGRRFLAAERDEAAVAAVAE